MHTFYESTNDYRSYLQHHGVKGMKWGVRHEQARKARKMKKHNITSEEYDKIRKDTKKVMKPIKGIMAGIGGLSGTLAGEEALINEANRHGMMALRRYNNSLPNPVPIDQYTRGASVAINKAMSEVINSSAIAVIPIGAAAGTALGYAGGKILEEVIAGNEMRTAGARRDRRYN